MLPDGVAFPNDAAEAREILAWCDSIEAGFAPVRLPIPDSRIAACNRQALEKR